MSDTVAREPRRHRQFWLDHIRQWAESGLSKAAYCKRHRLKPGSFYTWSSKEAATEPCSSADESLPPMTFLPVDIRQSPTDIVGVRVQRAATEVTLPPDLTPEQLRHWLAAIHALHV